MIAAINNQVDLEMRTIFYEREVEDFDMNSHTSRNCIIVKKSVQER